MSRQAAGRTEVDEGADEKQVGPMTRSESEKWSTTSKDTHTCKQKQAGEKTLETHGGLCG